jgi:Tfp pilus assembly protein PilF
MRWRLRLGLVSAGLIVYANALGGIFVFDDVLAIAENPHVRTLWPPWYAAWAEYESPLSGRPIPAFSLALNYALGGLDPTGYKLVNLLLHLACGLTLFSAVGGALRMPALAGRLGPRADDLAFSAALLWLVHPLASECVNYITQRTESWMALAYLSALACTARAWTSPVPGRWRALAVFACASGMASKEVMVSAPLAIVMFEWAYSGVALRTLMRQRALFYGALAACWVILAALMLASFRSDTVGFGGDIGATTYLWNQAQVIPRYLRLVVWPVGLAHDWGVPRPLELADVLPSLILTGGLLAIALWLTLRRPVMGWPLLFVFVVLAPTSSFIPILTEVAAERRMLLPLAALCALAVVAGADWANRVGVSDRVSGAVLLLVALALAGATLLRNDLYHDRLALWQDAAAVFPDNARAHTNVGQALVELGRYDASVSHLRRAIALTPDYAEGHNELAVALAALGLRSEAREQFERAVALEPEFATALRNLGMLLAAGDDRERARELLRRSLQLAPDSAKAARTLAWLLATDRDKRRPRRAVALAEHALEQGGESARSLDVLAAALAAAGELERAIDVATQAQQRATAEGRPELRVSIGARLERYRAGERWDEP